MPPRPNQTNSRNPRADAQANKMANARRPLQKLLIGFAMTFFGASMLLPFKDDTAGLWSIFSLMASFNPFNWLFLFTSLYYVRVIFRLHEVKLPILHALLIFMMMSVASINLYFQRFSIKVGIGIIFWLASGYLLVAASIRWRYPKGGLKSGFAALLLFTGLSVWVQGLYRDGMANHIWGNSGSLQNSEVPESVNSAASEPAIGVGSEALPNYAASASTVSKPSDLNQNSLIQVSRDFQIYNPWAQKDAKISCETFAKLAYPVLLPPRFLEDGYEWRSYQHGDGVCNNLMYVGTPYHGKAADIMYKIWQDRRSNIYVLMSNRADQALYNDSFTITRDTNGLAKKADYIKTLNAGFAHLIDDNSLPMADGEYVFSKAETPTQPDNLVAGCEMKAIKDRFNTYQWGTGRVSFRGQSIIKPQTYCSSNHVSIAHLSSDVAQMAKGTANALENRLHIKLFNAKDLKPVSCGSVAIALSASETQAWNSGQLRAESVQISPAQSTGCLNVAVKLNNGRVVQNDGN